MGLRKYYILEVGRKTSSSYSIWIGRRAHAQLEGFLAAHSPTSLDARSALIRAGRLQGWRKKLLHLWAFYKANAGSYGTPLRLTVYVMRKGQKGLYQEIINGRARP